MIFEVFVEWKVKEESALNISGVGCKWTNADNQGGSQQDRN